MSRTEDCRHVWKHSEFILERFQIYCNCLLYMLMSAKIYYHLLSFIINVVKVTYVYKVLQFHNPSQFFLVSGCVYQWLLKKIIADSVNQTVSLWLTSECVIRRKLLQKSGTVHIQMTDIFFHSEVKAPPRQSYRLVARHQQPVVVCSQLCIYPSCLVADPHGCLQFVCSQLPATTHQPCTFSHSNRLLLRGCRPVSGPVSVSLI